jgi:transketolase C-terminal domain/subunit
MISNGAILQFLNNRKRNINSAPEDKENNYQNSNNYLNKESTISMQDSSSLVRIDSDYKGQSWQANQIQNQLGSRAAQVGINNQQVT